MYEHIYRYLVSPIVILYVSNSNPPIQDRRKEKKNCICAQKFHFKAGCHPSQQELDRASFTVRVCGCLWLILTIYMRMHKHGVYFQTKKTKWCIINLEIDGAAQHFHWWKSTAGRFSQLHAIFILSQNA